MYTITYFPNPLSNNPNSRRQSAGNYSRSPSIYTRSRCTGRVIGLQKLALTLEKSCLRGQSNPLPIRQVENKAFKPLMQTLDLIDVSTIKYLFTPTFFILIK
ncbi:hypothetical protein RchiOBHm_Chr6g0244871 [Rosa chinensis]|uniref:Uncharacterized protein n=1 Tax=Rosa chinensis TaxID=74649 RepID=A0A2P6PJ38_ROSCH|nr:hypothetical protein RchiOBHm_Chr6g0244871 [Rosa chinensis]